MVKNHNASSATHFFENALEVPIASLGGILDEDFVRPRVRKNNALTRRREKRIDALEEEKSFRFNQLSTELVFEAGAVGAVLLVQYAPLAGLRLLERIHFALGRLPLSYYLQNL